MYSSQTLLLVMNYMINYELSLLKLAIDPTSQALEPPFGNPLDG